ncbi:MAG: hypothetical protein C3F13_16895 [Anaerolineales bacterium]|nr:DUF385 domain-containing protein [Anaerolineae bacterium]PWB50147.1 MAG: hypothetical protein C3F13_16895 [Anaerolineales bacterium]
MWFNPIMESLLRSPFHGMLSNNMMIIYYTGRKSGNAYHTPVSYQRLGNTLLTTSWKDRKWWKNLRQGGDVKLLLKGELVEAHAQVYEDETSVSEGLRQFVGGNPRAARMFKIDLREDGQLDPQSLQKAAGERVFISTALQ